MRFRDRSEAGHVLGRVLEDEYKARPGVLILGLPRGGVPVAYEVACALNAPLDVFIVRKLGLPGHEELAMGAIATGGFRVVNHSVLEQFRVSAEILEAVTAQENEELQRREHLYRGNRPKHEVSGRTLIVVDDGLATGSTMRVALAALRPQNPARIVVAVPTAAAETCAALKTEADQIVCATTPAPFYSVGAWYENFDQTSDEEVTGFLLRSPTQRQE